jgi:hypothetical protein
LNTPLEILGRCRKRLARLAVVRSLTIAGLPIAVTLGIALDLDSLNTLAFDHLGLLMDSGRLLAFQKSLLELALAGLVAIGVLAWVAWSSTQDLVKTAEQIDKFVGGRQEIVTLASLSVPVRPDTTSPRSPLFPVLSQRVVTYLETFNPNVALPLELREPFLRSLLLAILAFAFLTSVAFALMSRPSATQSVIRHLQSFAESTDGSAPSSGQRQLAAAASDIAKDLTNPKLPPREKLAELDALRRELEKSQAQPHPASEGKGSSSGVGNRGGGGNGSGSGSSQGAGNGSSGKGSGTAQNGSGTSKGGNGSQQMAELQNDIAKAQTKLEQETNSADKTTTARNDSSKGTATAPRPGSERNQTGGRKSADASGQVSQPQTVGSSQMPSGESPGRRPNDQGTAGDTHLGEFPKAGNYQRFYKLGERGPAISLRDARYVTFQLPSEVESVGGGPVVPDRSRPQATTPYTNSPLKPIPAPVSPDEEQLVPPRYRELIH